MKIYIKSFLAKLFILIFFREKKVKAAKAIVICRFDHLGDFIISKDAINSFNSVSKIILITDRGLSYFNQKIPSVDKYIFIDQLSLQVRGFSFCNLLINKLRISRALSEYDIEHIYFLRPGPNNEDDILLLNHYNSAQTTGFWSKGMNSQFRGEFLKEKISFVEGAHLRESYDLQFGLCKRNIQFSINNSNLNIYDIVICAESSKNEKDLNLETLNEIIHFLPHFKIALIGVKKYVGHMFSGVDNLVGETDLNEVFSIIQKAKIFIGVDSGPKHIASMYDIPIIEFNSVDFDESNIESPTYFKAWSKDVLVIVLTLSSLKKLPLNTVEEVKKFIMAKL